MNWLVPAQIGLQMGLIMFFAVLGLAVAYRLFSFPDITVEGSFLFGAVGFAVLHREGFGPLPSIAGAMALGACAGALTGGLHARFRLNKFLTGIIVVAIAYSVSLRLMAGPNIGLLAASTSLDTAVMRWSPLGLDAGKVLGLAVLGGAIGWFMVALVSSRPGLRWRVAGCNPDHARSLGIGLITSSMMGLALTNALAALSGALLAVHQGFADVGLGQGMLIFALASMSIGDRLLSERRFAIPVFVVLSSALGSVTYQCLIAGAVSAGLNPVDLKLITAVLVLVVVVARRKRSDDPLAAA